MGSTREIPVTLRRRERSIRRMRQAKPEHSIVLVMQTISDGDEMESVQRRAFDKGGEEKAQRVEAR
jgi:hypothetical protein